MLNVTWLFMLGHIALLPKKKKQITKLLKHSQKDIISGSDLILRITLITIYVVTYTETDQLTITFLFVSLFVILKDFKINFAFIL